MVGIALVLLGIAVGVGALAVDWLGAGKWDGLGPAQQLAIGAGVLIAVAGAGLIPLGDRPA
jgi:hypothetical protein